MSPPTDTSVRLTLESNTRTKAGNSTLPGGKSEQPSSDSKTGDQHPITDIAQVDPSIIAQAATSDIGNSITPPTDIDQAFADFWQHYPPTNHSKPAHVVRSVFLAAVKAGIDTKAIITGASRYAAARAGQDPQYTMAMSNWLKRRSWQGTDKLPDRASTNGLASHPHARAALSGFQHYLQLQQKRGNHH